MTAAPWVGSFKFTARQRAALRSATLTFLDRAKADALLDEAERGLAYYFFQSAQPLDRAAYHAHLKRKRDRLLRLAKAADEIGDILADKDSACRADVYLRLGQEAIDRREPDANIAATAALEDLRHKLGVVAASFTRWSEYMRPTQHRPADEERRLIVRGLAMHWTKHTSTKASPHGRFMRFLTDIGKQDPRFTVTPKMVKGDLT